MRTIKWYKILEDLALLVGILKKVQLVVTDGLTKELCIGAHLVAKQVIRLRKKSGPLFVCCSLSKTSSSLLTESVCRGPST